VADPLGAVHTGSVVQPSHRCNRPHTTTGAIALLAAYMLACVPPAHAATRYDPSLRFRSMTTPHFVIHYHQGEEALALRLSLIVERVHADLTARMQHAPRGRTHVVLVDQADDPNGWATPVPYNLIEMTAVPPTGDEAIGNTSEWLRLVFTHEYAHVLHLDRSRGWAALARGVFGRAPFVFPNLTLPLWHIEGLATFEESRAGEGRLAAGDFQAVVAEAARAGAFEPLDRVSGGLIDWPAGNGWYAYGAYFHAYLARRFGEEKLADLSRRTAGRLPYFGATAFRTVYGASLGRLWRDFSRDFPPAISPNEAAQAGAGAGSSAVRLTHHGYLVSGPRFDRDGTIVYSRRDAHGFPSLDRISLDGGGARRLATRYGGEQVGLSDDALYFDQLEIRGNVALSSDLYRLDRRTGAVRRLTNGARLTDVDLSPDGRRVAAVHLSGGVRTLVIIDREQLEGGRAAFETGSSAREATVFASPRWSPDGRHIAVERRARGGPSEIVLVDADTRGETVVATSPSGRNVTPAWAPDGRALLFASDRSGGPFDLYRVTLAAHGNGLTPMGLERLTGTTGGAKAPDVSPDGRTVLFVGYTIDGDDVFSMPLALARAPSAERAADDPRPASQAVPVDAPAAGQARPGPYRPWSTLLPRAWLPVVETGDHETRVGAAMAGTDALGYHRWAATASWSVARETAVEPVSPGARPDLLLAYAYDRWRPTFFTQYADETTPLLLRDGTDGGRQPLALRERSVDVGALVPFRRVRWSQAALASWRREHSVVSGPSAAGEFDRGALRLGWSVNTARRYGYSISPEDGVTAGAAVELTRRGLGGDGDAELYRADTRGFLRLGLRHGVLALRASGAASRGDASVRRTLRLGGHGADGGVLSFEEDGSSLLRGFPADTFLGTNVVLGNAEYRLPLGWVERGIGTWPVFLRAVHVSGFVDAGHAWTGRFTAADAKVSWGVEAGADVTAGYALPFTWMVGVGWGRDLSNEVPDNREMYVRIGRGF
jgi:Tol biopolymer transport system component